MTQAALGKGGSSAFQVSVSTLTLGTLYEAILSFSRQESLDRFWPSVCQNARWLIPSRKMCVLLAGDDGFEVVAAYERGRAVAAVDFEGARQDLSEALTRNNTQWFFDPAQRFGPGQASLTQWMLADGPETLFALPVLTGRTNIGSMLFVMGAIDEGDQAMLNTLGTIYALHVGMTFTLINITQQQQLLQRQLVMKEKMASLGKLVAGLLHEMNSPVGAIHSAADVTRRAVEKVGVEVSRADSVEALQAARFQQTLQILRTNSQVTLEAGERISGLMSNLRSFVRLDEAEFQLARIEEGIDSALALLEPETGPGVRVVREYGGLGPTFCSPGQLNQAFMNVLQNAVQAVRGDGEVRVRTWQAGADQFVEIEDTGVGIAPEQLRHIFEVTFRADTRVRMGSGLSVAYHIVDEHGGEINVDSVVGKGTCVRIQLPVRREGDAGSTPKEA